MNKGNKTATYLGSPEKVPDETEIKKARTENNK